MTVEIAVEGHAPLREGACRVIAKAGVNHNNSVDRAVELARRAAQAGAWAIKFQLYKADAISVPASPKYWHDPFGTATQHEAFSLSDRLPYEAYGEIAAACRELGIAFFATPFDLQAVAALEALDTPVYKIASGDITHRGLIEAVAATARPILLATGASTADEVHQAVEWSGLGPDRLCLLACTLTYPHPRRRRALRADRGLPARVRALPHRLLRPHPGAGGSVDDRGTGRRVHREALHA